MVGSLTLIAVGLRPLPCFSPVAALLGVGCHGWNSASTLEMRARERRKDSFQRGRVELPSITLGQKLMEESVDGWPDFLTRIQIDFLSRAG